MKRTPLSQEVKTLVKEIVQLAMVISEETKHDVFVQYAPHVQALQWFVYDGGYTDESCAESIKTIWLDDKTATKRLIDCGVYLADMAGAEFTV